MKGTINGQRLLVSLPLLEEPRASSTGKTQLVATSRGFKKTSAKVNGQVVYASVNALIRKSAHPSGKRGRNK